MSRCLRRNDEQRRGRHCGNAYLERSFGEAFASGRDSLLDLAALQPFCIGTEGSHQGEDAGRWGRGPAKDLGPRVCLPD